MKSPHEEQQQPAAGGPAKAVSTASGNSIRQWMREYAVMLG